jgi:hypothetical protein
MSLISNIHLPREHPDSTGTSNGVIEAPPEKEK